MRNRIIGVCTFFTLLAIISTSCTNPAVEGMPPLPNEQQTVLDRSRATVNLENGKRDIWSAEQKNNLTYKLSALGSNHDAVTSLMHRATAEWECAADIDFLQVSSNEITPLFIVRSATTDEEQNNPDLVTHPFYPGRYARELVLYQRFFNKTDTERLSTLLHDLGHILGLRHEHIWNDPTQQELTLFPADLLTTVDTSSIMYDSSKPGYTGDGKLSALDKRGIMSLYGGNNGLVALHRYWNPINTSHYYTTSWNELEHGKLGYNYEGVQGFVHSENVSNTVPLHRYVNHQAGKHFLTTSFNELGLGNSEYTYAGIACYVYNTMVTGSVALHRYSNSISGDFFYTTNLYELGNGNSGYSYEGIQCYILP